MRDQGEAVGRLGISAVGKCRRRQSRLAGLNFDTAEEQVSARTARSRQRSAWFAHLYERENARDDDIRRRADTKKDKGVTSSLSP